MSLRVLDWQQHQLVTGRIKEITRMTCYFSLETGPKKKDVKMRQRASSKAKAWHVHEQEEPETNDIRHGIWKRTGRSKLYRILTCYVGIASTVRMSADAPA